MSIIRIKSPLAPGGTTPAYTYADHDESGLDTVWNSAWGRAHRPGPDMDWSTTPVVDVYRFDQDDLGRTYTGKVLVSMNQGPVTIYAHAGDNVIVGGDFADFLSGGRGSDFILGGAGSDYLSGNGGNDLLYGQEGGDMIADGAGADKVFGGSGDDVIYSTGSADRWPSPHAEADGADLFAGGTGSDWVSYAWANQGAIASLNDHTMNSGSAATDRFNSIENLGGSAFDDWLIGDGGANTIAGDRGNDTLAGNGGNDSVLGGDGNDYLFGDAGDDQLDGGAGDDVLYAGTGDDLLTGGGGLDRLFGQDGNDFFYNLEAGSLAAGGNGHDIVSLSGTAADWVIDDLGMVQEEDSLAETHLFEFRQLLPDGTYDGRISVTGIEQVVFSDGSVLFL